MAIAHTSWLHRNDARSYPFSDRANVDPSALVDLHVTFPRTLASNAKRVFVSRLVVTNEYAELTVELEDTGVLGTVDILNPQPYRMYALTTASGNIHGFVSFGQAAINEELDVDQTLNADSGEVLESLVYRYLPSAIEAFLVGNDLVDGNVVFTGQDGVVCEIVDVYYDLEAQSVPSLVLRMEHDPQVMIDPIPECRLLLESGAIDSLVSKINGVRPDSLGRIFLQFQGGADLEYDSEDNIVTDENGNPVYNMNSPVVELYLIPGAASHVLGFKDNYDYRRVCNNVAPRRIVYSANKCVYCTPTIDEVNGVDGSGGSRITWAGAYVTGDQLTNLWYYYGDNAMAVGPAIDDIQVQLDDDEVLGVFGGVVEQGTSPYFPGSLVPCSREHSSTGNLGEVGVTRHTLPRSLDPEEQFALDIPAGAVQDSPLAGLPYYNPAAKTCTFSAQNPNGGITAEEQAALDEEYF